MAPIKWHQCTPPPVPAPVSPLPMAAQSRAPPQPPPSPLLTAPAPAPLSAPPPWPPYGGGRGGEGREGAGGGREPSGSGRSRHLPLPPPAGHGSARIGTARLGSAQGRTGAPRGSGAGRQPEGGSRGGAALLSRPAAGTVSPFPSLLPEALVFPAAAPGHGLHGNSCCRRCCTDSASTSCTAPPPWSLGVQPCAHCVCQNRPFQELQKTFLASFFHLQDQKGKRGFCNWEAGEESGGPRFPLDIWVLPAEFAALGVVFVELGPALLRRRQGLEGGRENQEQVSPSIFL
ncbi:formin-like protein 14 isoform X2 [Melopsittacus undulatus]|uniref:formin-like protein 14 isoform X2 n=1 Tax=Melopsittacus undulatus TaxID=13146 RepID=UPI00146C131E|nr:formin-like protein 14 isoform X2 [Melopsittacus undulatus]